MVDESVRDQVKVCIDTQHIFGAGEYDFGIPDEFDRFIETFEEHIGLEKLELFHLNDSRAKFHAKKDRHEYLGIGYIFGEERESEGYGLSGLKYLVEFAEEKKIPLIGEPPAKTAEGKPGLGGMWDYSVVNELCNLAECTCL